MSPDPVRGKRLWCVAVVFGMLYEAVATVCTGNSYRFEGACYDHPTKIKFAVAHDNTTDSFTVAFYNRSSQAWGFLDPVLVEDGDESWVAIFLVDGQHMSKFSFSVEEDHEHKFEQILLNDTVILNSTFWLDTEKPMAGNEPYATTAIFNFPWSTDSDSNKTICHCRKGTFCSTTYSQVHSLCQVCPLGTFAGSVDAMACRTWNLCDIGTYIFSNGTAQLDRTCKACPQGKIAPSQN